MTSNYKICVCCLLAFALLLAVDCRQKAGGESEEPGQTIEFLISAVANSHLTFIRNGQCYTCEQAAKHIRDKYDYFRPEIKTPETFIDRCATGSIVSGEPYLVITAQGKVALGKWLRQMLAEHRGSNGG
jgi:tRNA-dihydrouridine synthase